MYKFERLKVYQLTLDYIDKVYLVAAKPPRNEEYNLSSQIKRAATSIALHIGRFDRSNRPRTSTVFGYGHSLAFGNCCL